MSAPREEHRPHQEPDVLPGRSAILWIAGSVAAVVAVAVGSWALLLLFEGPAAPPDGGGTGEVGRPDAPVGAAYRGPARPAAPDSAGREELESYRWIDRDEGVVSVPVEKTMEILTDDGARDGGFRNEAAGDEAAGDEAAADEPREEGPR